jgi:nucleotide-binding universal stress UspA family protein
MKKFTKILVPVVGMPYEDEVIRFASLVARQDKASLLLIYVIEIQRTLPLDAENAPEIERGEAVLQHAEHVANENKVRAETELLQARVVGSVLIDEANERRVDLIIMGVPYREPIGEFLLGRTASYMMKNASCPVWICREAASVMAGANQKP